MIDNTSNMTLCDCNNGSAVTIVGGLLGTTVIIQLLLLILAVTALLYPRLIRPRISKNKHLLR